MAAFIENIDAVIRLTEEKSTKNEFLTFVQ